MKKEIIIIDDDAVYRMLIGKMINFAAPSLQISEAENGKIGLEKLKTLQGASHEIIILLDVHMPIENGWGFLDEMQANDFYNLQNLTIYMVSSSIDESDQQKAQQYNSVKEFLFKPLTNEQIRAIV